MTSGEAGGVAPAIAGGRPAAATCPAPDEFVSCGASPCTGACMWSGIGSCGGPCTSAGAIAGAIAGADAGAGSQ